MFPYRSCLRIEYVKKDGLTMFSQAILLIHGILFNFLLVSISMAWYTKHEVIAHAGNETHVQRLSIHLSVQ